MSKTSNYPSKLSDWLSSNVLRKNRASISQKELEGRINADLGPAPSKIILSEFICSTLGLSDDTLINGNYNNMSFVQKPVESVKSVSVGLMAEDEIKDLLRHKDAQLLKNKETSAKLEANYESKIRELEDELDKERESVDTKYEELRIHNDENVDIIQNMGEKIDIYKQEIENLKAKNIELQTTIDQLNVSIRDSIIERSKKQDKAIEESTKENLEKIEKVQKRIRKRKSPQRSPAKNRPKSSEAYKSPKKYNGVPNMDAIYSIKPPNINSSRKFKELTKEALEELDKEY